METRVRKWGNSLAVRLSKQVVRELNLSEGAYVAIDVDEGKISLEARGTKRYSLRQLLAKVTRKNLHGESESGPPVSQEIW